MATACGEKNRKPRGDLNEERREGILYLVGTPIGNLEDISARALRVLNEVELIAVEDTRQTKKLLAYFKISKPLLSFYKENERIKTQEVIGLLLAGKQIALVSDAGMPGISDPGSFLVKEAVEKGVRIVPVPGPSASLVALTASSLPTRRFVFEGFLPRKPKDRKSQLKRLAPEPRTIILYESPHRIRETLRDIEEFLGSERFIVIARELTKVYEEFWRGTVAEAVKEWEERTIKGEFTLVIQGDTEQKENPEEILESYQRLSSEIKDRVEQGEKLSSVIRAVANRERISRRGLYQWFLAEKAEKNEDK